MIDFQESATNLLKGKTMASGFFRRHPVLIWLMAGLLLPIALGLIFLTRDIRFGIQRKSRMSISIPSPENWWFTL
jgi:hypothetical protein